MIVFFFKQRSKRKRTNELQRVPCCYTGSIRSLRSILEAPEVIGDRLKTVEATNSQARRERDMKARVSQKERQHSSVLSERWRLWT